MNSVDMLFKITVMLTAVLAFSIVIERFLEILVTLTNWVDGKANWYTYWTKRTYKLRDYLEKRIRLFEYVDKKNVASILHKFRNMMLNETGEYEGTVPVLSGNLLRAATIKVASKFVGIGLGIGIALWIKLDLLALWQNASRSAEWIVNIPKQVCIVLSGIALGLGSVPVHKIVSTIEKKQAQKRKKGVVS